MNAPYQARDDTAVMRAGSGGVSICGMMPTNGLKVKRRLLHLFAFLRGVDEHQVIFALVSDDGVARLALAPAH